MKTRTTRESSWSRCVLLCTGVIVLTLTRDNQVELFCLSKPTRKVTYSASLTFGSVAESVLLHLANLLLNLNCSLCI